MPRDRNGDELYYMETIMHLSMRLAAALQRLRAVGRDRGMKWVDRGLSCRAMPAGQSKANGKGAD